MTAPDLTAADVALVRELAHADRLAAGSLNGHRRKRVFLERAARADALAGRIAAAAAQFHALERQIAAATERADAAARDGAAACDRIGREFDAMRRRAEQAERRERGRLEEIRRLEQRVADVVTAAAIVAPPRPFYVCSECPALAHVTGAHNGNYALPPVAPVVTVHDAGAAGVALDAARAMRERVASLFDEQSTAPVLRNVTAG